MVEPSAMTAPRIGETIPPDANRLLTEMGVWNEVLGQGHLPCHGSVSAWGGRRAGHNDFVLNPHGHGWHLDRALFDRSLLAAAEARGAVVLRDEVAGAGRTATGIEVRLVSGEALQAEAVIDATGPRAVVARGFGARKRFEDRLVVISAEFRGAAKLGRSTWLEAARDGWWYAAGLPDDRAVVAIGTDPRIAKAGGWYGLRRWLAGLAATGLLAGRLEDARLARRELRVSNAHSWRLDRIAGPGWAAAGDAAMGFDPLSSAGIMKALTSGRAAGRALILGRGFEEYAAGMEADWAAYLGLRRGLYEAEGRWPEAAFWTARRGRVFAAV